MSINRDRALELLEQAEREIPFCACGRPTMPVGRPGGVWLECSSMQVLFPWHERPVPKVDPGRAHVGAWSLT